VAAHDNEDTHGQGTALATREGSDCTPSMNILNGDM
jgi:hypothetical protein